VDLGNGRLRLHSRNIFIFLPAIIFLYSCEIEESKNTYKPPSIEISSKIDKTSNAYSIEVLESVGDELSNLLNKEIDLFSSNEVKFEGEIISKYIDCGFMNNEVYVNYIDRIFGSYLEAVITFKIVNEDNLYRINNDEIRYTFFSKETGTRWRFKSNKPKELLVGNPVYSDNPYRTCLSKNVLEKKIKYILNSTSQWRTLTRGWSYDHHVIIESGAWRMGMYDNNSAGFMTNGYDQRNLWTYADGYGAFVWRWSDSDQPTYCFNHQNAAGGLYTASFNNSISPFTAALTAIL